jgi:predicted dehydrogenase
MEPLRLECEDFARSIRTGEQPEANGRIGLEVVRLLTAAQASLRGRQQIA